MTDKSIFSGEAKELTLNQLLESCKKQRIKSIAERYGLKLSDKTTKPQMIEALLPVIGVQFSLKLKHYSREELRIIMDCLTEKAIPAEKAAEAAQSAPFSDGVIFLSVKKDSYFASVPHELAGKAMMRCVTECVDSGEEELAKTAAACAALYGRFSPELLCEAAEIAYGLKITNQQAEQFLASDQSGRFSYDNGTAIAGYDGTVREEAQPLGYYLPTRKEADSFASFGADSSDYYYRHITQFFYNNTGLSYDETRALIRRIAAGCAADRPITGMLDDVRQSGAVMTTEQFNFVIGMITDLFNRSRKFSLKGHLPDEVEGVGPVRMPAIQAVPSKSGPYRAEEKIGRNDPCPCGSGKKYKKCCGKKL